MSPRRHPAPWLAATLFLMNLVIVAKLFRTEYLSQTGTVEGIFIAYARYARDHWPDLGWCRLWFAGMPFQNAYPPGLHLTTALVSYLRQIGVARAFHIVVALMYSLGPVTLFWMALRLTRTVSWSFYSGLLYSLISPSAFLVPEIRRDLGSLLGARRLQTPVTWGDSPHVCSLTLIPLAIVALDVALARRRPVFFVLAALALAAVPLTNWPGAIVLAFALMAYGFSLPSKTRPRAAASILGVALLAYCLAVPWMPPSTVINTETEVQAWSAANRFSLHHLVYAAAIGAGIWILLRLTARGVEAPLRFFLLFFLFMAAITLGYYWLGLTLLAEPHRFHLAMEMGLVLTLMSLAQCMLERWPALAKPAALLFAVLCVFQLHEYTAYADRLIQPLDMTRSSEFKIGGWFDQHMRQSRVMVPGSVTFWLNAFTDTPQLTGCCRQSVLPNIVPIANYGILTDLTAENHAFESSLLWFKALGVRAVAVSGPRSTEVYKPFAHPHKFDGRLPVLWRDGDDVIYEVPWRYYSLAHAMEPVDLVPRTPIHGVDTDPLIPYVAAIESPEAPPLDVRWPDNETMVISGRLRSTQIVSVQVASHFGWHATVAGRDRPVFPDRLGLLVVAPHCSGPCTIELRYDGGVEMKTARWIERTALGGCLMWLLSAGWHRWRVHPG
jgi:hypothetical protein